MGAAAPTVARVGCGAEVPAAHSCVPWEHPGSTPGVPREYPVGVGARVWGRVCSVCVCVVGRVCQCGRVCVCVCVVCVCVCSACSVPIPSHHVPQECVGAHAPATNVARGHHARSTAHGSSNAAAVAQAASRPCRPALPLVAARLHGCHDNLDSRMAAAALQGRRLRSGSQLAAGLGAVGGGGWCGAREGEVDCGAERSASAGFGARMLDAHFAKWAKVPHTEGTTVAMYFCVGRVC